MSVNDVNVKLTKTEKQNIKQIKRRKIFRRLFLVVLLLIFIFLVGNTLYNYYKGEGVKEIVKEEVTSISKSELNFGDKISYIKRMNTLLKKI